jgi:hypothetical protein
LPGLARRKVTVRPLLRGEVDEELVPAVWQKAVFANPGLPSGAADQDTYVVCVLEQLHRALLRRDIYRCGRYSVRHHLAFRALHRAHRPTAHQVVTGFEGNDDAEEGTW